jgi:hypothetical protein
LGAEPTLQPDLLQSAVITWGARAFSHVIFPADEAGIARTDPALLPGYIAPFSDLERCCPVSDYRFPSEDGSVLHIRLPIILPINRPSPLPPGIIGSTSLGVDGIAAIMRDHFQLEESYASWLSDPATVAWLTAVAKSPSTFAVDATAYEDAAESLWPYDDPDGTMVRFQSPLAASCWHGLECTLSYRLLLDLVSHAHGNPRSKSRCLFLRYLQQAYRDLYLADGPFGPKPIELAFELLFLRPPNVAAWAKRFGLRSWTMDTAPSYLSVFKLQSFDTKTYTFWPWETVDGTPVPPLAVHPRPAGTRHPAPATIFPATDARVTNPDYDTPNEATERSLLTQLSDISALLARNPAPAEVEQLESSRAFLRDHQGANPDRFHFHTHKLQMFRQNFPLEMRFSQIYRQKPNVIQNFQKLDPNVEF